MGNGRRVAIARPLAVMFKRAKVWGKERGWATVARHANEKRRERLGLKLHAFQRGRATGIYTIGADAIETSTLPIMLSRIRRKREGASERNMYCWRQTRTAMFDIQIRM